jgi:hypothetical protein
LRGKSAIFHGFVPQDGRQGCGDITLTDSELWMTLEKGSSADCPWNH